MKCKLVLLTLALLCVIPGALSATFTEDFESYVTFGIIPPTVDQNWYTFHDGTSISKVVTAAPILQGAKSLRVTSNGTTASQNVAFDVDTANQLTSVTFIIRGATLTENGGTKQFVTLSSSAPARALAQFFVMCKNDDGNAAHNDACQLKVRWQEVDATGQELIPYSAGTKAFNITMTMDWVGLKYALTVNGVSDGNFPFYQIPKDFQEIQIAQYTTSVPMVATFDYFKIVGAAAVANTTVQGDIAQGITDFATNMHFASSAGLFVFGLIVFLILNTALIFAMFTHGKNNTIAPAASIFAIIAVLWLIEMKYWPDWIDVAMIIYVAAMVGLILRRVMLGIRSVGNSGPSMVVGALGYFIICGVFLAMAGYTTSQVSVPSGSVSQSGSTSQSFGGAVVECIVTLFGDCSQSTTSALWNTITDIFGWIIAAVQYLFQLMTFQLPIPVVLNMMIVLPPAAALGAYAVQLIRG